MIPMLSLFDSRKQKKLLSPCHVTAWQSTRLKVLIVLAYFMPRFKEMEILFFIYSTRGSAENVKLLSGWQSARATCFHYTTSFPGCARHKGGRKVVFNSFKSSARSFFQSNFSRAIFTRGSPQTQANHRQTARERRESEDSFIKQTHQNHVFEILSMTSTITVS